jgi:hypothetical protein
MMIVVTPCQQKCKIEVIYTMKRGPLPFGIFCATNEKLFETWQ